MQRREFLLTAALTAAVQNSETSAQTIETGITSLHEAAEKNDVEAITALLNAGADVNVKNIFNQTPLQYAEKCNNTEAVAILHKAGAKQV